jgi:hypothetical protein
MRARWLLALAEEPAQLSELLEAAGTQVGSPLRFITLEELIATARRCSLSKAREVVRRIVSTCVGGSGGGVRPDVRWLLDYRAGGRRLAAFADAMTPLREGPPWEGFPWTVVPEGDVR